MIITGPKRHEVFKILKNKSAQWDRFARELQIPDNHRDGLKSSNLSDDEKLEAILRKWMESETRPVSWNTVMDVLNELEMRDSMREVKEFLDSQKAGGKQIPL